MDLNALAEIYNQFDMPLYLPYEAWNEAVPVYSSGQRIGKATSGMWSPVLKKYIAIARIRPQFSKPGTLVDLEVTIDAHRKHVRSTVVKMPFYNPPRKRSDSRGLSGKGRPQSPGT